MEDDVPGVTLRPARTEDLWIFEQQANDPEVGGIFNWSGYRDISALTRQFEENRLIGSDGGCLLIVIGKSLLGTVAWTKVTYGTPAWCCWNIGIALLPAHRGQGFGSAAQKLLVSYLFNTTNFERVEAYTDVDNIPERRALERIGFTEEGVLRSVQFRYGRWRDMVMYSILRDEHKI